VIHLHIAEAEKMDLQVTSFPLLFDYDKFSTS